MFLKFICLYVAIVCVTGAPPVNVVPLEKKQPTVIPIVAQSEELESNGTLKFSYETGNGIKREETSYDKILPKAKGAPGDKEGVDKDDDSNEIHVQEGSYSYTAPDGTVITVRYIADENGFRPIGDHLPKPPSIQNSGPKLSKIQEKDSSRSGSEAAEVIVPAPINKPLTSPTKSTKENLSLKVSETPKLESRIGDPLTDTTSPKSKDKESSTTPVESTTTDVPSTTTEQSVEQTTSNNSDDVSTTSEESSITSDIPLTSTEKPITTSEIPSTTDIDLSTKEISLPTESVTSDSASTTESGATENASISDVTTTEADAEHASTTTSAEEARTLSISTVEPETSTISEATTVPESTS